MKFQIIDAFSDEIFGGNPAGVVLIDEGAEFPSEEIMVKTAAELRYSETAFIRTMGEKEFNIRYFTPAAEVDLCGHATIGAFGAMLEWGKVRDNESYTINTLAGKLTIEITDGFIFMEMGQPKVIGTIDSDEGKSELASVMGINLEDLIFDPDLVSTGLPDIMLAVNSEEVLNKISPDFKALSNLSEKYNVVGVHAFSLAEDEAEVTAHCRNFAPLYEIDEEAATGTSNGALTVYLYNKGLIKEGDTNVFIQGESMNRPSKIMSKLTLQDNKMKIQVGGVYKKLAEGNIYI
ncbi:MAG: PhzF family phenazine biosynthesis protein [Aminipila sp.]